MLEKNHFCDLMRRFQELEADTRAVHNALKALDPDFGGLYLGRHENFLMDLMQELMGDTGKDSWISYFVYERDWGKNKSKLAPVTIEGVNYRLDTLGQLYDLMVLHPINKPTVC